MGQPRDKMGPIIGDGSGKFLVKYQIFCWILILRLIVDIFKVFTDKLSLCPQLCSRIKVFILTFTEFLEFLSLSGAVVRIS